jgi:hypothetical protein
MGDPGQVPGRHLSISGMRKMQYIVNKEVEHLTANCQILEKSKIHGIA